jgi:electron transport complex protein RnfG
MKNIVTLIVVVVVAVAFVSYTYNITEPIIKQKKYEVFRKEITGVFPLAERYEKNPAYKNGKFIGDYFIIYDKANNIRGYLAIVEKQGYSSRIKIGVFFGRDKHIKKVRIFEQMETPGVGSKVSEDFFLNRFIKKPVDNIDTISGATISSSAVIDGVRKSFEIIKE